MAERDYTPDEARKLEDKYQAGTMAPANRPLWEQRRDKYLPALSGVTQQPHPPATMQALPPTLPQPTSGAVQQVETPAGPGAGEQIRGTDRPSLDEPGALASARRAASKAATMPTTGARPAQTRGQQFGTLEQDVEGWKDTARMVGETGVMMALSSLIPGGAAVSAYRYAQMAPAARTVYWTARQVLQPLVRNGVIGLATGGVPLLFGKPMSEAVRTAIFTTLGESLGSGAQVTKDKVLGMIRTAVKESPQGEIAGEVLTQLGQKSTVGMRTGSERYQAAEHAFRERLGGGPLRRVQDKAEGALSDELRRVEQRLSPRDIQGNPDALVRESITVAKSRLDEQAAERFGGIDVMIAHRQRPDTGTFPKAPREGVGPERVRWDVDPEAGTVRMGAEPTAQTPPGQRPPLPTGKQPTDRVSLGAAKATAAALLAQTRRTGVPTKEGEGLLMAMLNHPEDSLSFGEAQKLLSNWLKVSRRTEGLMPDQAHGFAAKLSSALYGELEKAAKSNGAEVYSAWRATRDWYKAAIQKFDNTIVERLLSAEPDVVFSTIAQEGAPIAIKTARQAIDNPILWDKIGQAWMQKTLEANTNRLTNTIKGDALLETVGTFARNGALQELFPKGHGRDIYDLALSLAQIQRGGGRAAPWNRIVQLLPAGGLALAVGGEVEHMHRHSGVGKYAEDEEAPMVARWPLYYGVPLILAPAMISRVMASPRLTRALLEGTRAIPDHRRRLEVAGGIMGLLSEEGLFGAQTPPLGPLLPQGYVPVGEPAGHPIQTTGNVR